MSKLLVIGAGWEQYALIEEAKKQGHYIIATHPAMNTDGFSLADRFYVKDSRDITSHLEIARTYEIDAIITDNCDFSLYTASVISKTLGLPFNSIKSALGSNDKLAQRKACSLHNIVQPEFYEVKTYEELTTAAKKLQYPLILKPVDSRGTFGVSKIESAEGLESAFVDALANSLSRTLICEKFINGTLVTVDGFVFKNGHRSLAVASRTFEDGIKPVTKEIIYPARFTTEINSKLMENHQAVVKALGYDQGHTHGEYIITDENKIFLVECTNRGGGVYTSSTIVPFLTRINLNEILINQSLGIDTYHIEGEGPELMKNSVILAFLDFSVGKVVESINTDEVRAMPTTLQFRSIYGPDDMIESIENCASRHSAVVVQGTDVQNSIKNFEEMKNKLNVSYYEL